MGRRKRKKQDPHTDARIQSIFNRRHPGRDEPEYTRHAVKDVIADGDPLFMVDHLYRPATLRDIWKHRAGFLVCGGPSLNEIDKDRLGDRGIVSLGVNNVAAYAPVRAFTCSDPPTKFHHGIWLDPALMKIVPIPKLKQSVRAKVGDEWVPLELGCGYPMKVRDCPNVWGYKRSCEWWPGEFLTSNAATWGNNDKGVKATGGHKLLFTFFLALRLVYYLGLRRCYLLGVDFHMSEQYGYSFGQGRDAGASRSNNNSYRHANQWLCKLRPELEAGGMEVYNCNPHSSLEAFDHVPFEQAYLDCQGPMPRQPFDLSGWYEKHPNRSG